MNKILKLSIALLLTLTMLFSLSSCLFVNPDGSQDSKNSYDTENELKDTEYISDSDLVESGTDTDTDTNNDADSNVSSDSDTEIDSSDDVVDDNPCKHLDYDKNDYCDTCNEYLIVVIDFYAINDLHGKFCDSSAQPGVDELGTYFENKKQEDDYTVLLSSGDMWQGSAESVLTYGKIMVEWMNELGFASMTLGNHEFDWGEQIIKDNALIADFPFLAINIYSSITDEPVEYCSPSVILNRGDIQIGIIGAIGDCYSSISSDMVTDIYFKTGKELTALVKEEALRLRSLGVDLIVYSIHDGLESSSNSFNHYDSSLSSGYVDMVFEGHTHSAYVKNDSNGVVHIQGGAENYGLSHIEISINSITGDKSITSNEIIRNNSYAELEDHEPTEIIESKYSEIIDYAYATLGTVSKKQYSDDIADYVAELYLIAGKEKWGNKYDIALGGGFLQTRSPYDLSAGAVSYADILSLLPFNNRIVLCSINGLKLNSQFINTSNKSYHIALNENFDTSNISSNKTYYVIVDMYTALYKYNGLTIVDYYDQTTYARDLYAEAVKNGALGSGSTDIPIKPDTEYTFTSVEQALERGSSLKNGEETAEFYYFKGILSDFSNLTYGNCYITDEAGNKIFVYGLDDIQGNRYDAMPVKPTQGDTVIIRSNIKKYQYSSGDIIIELFNSVVIAINP